MFWNDGGSWGAGQWIAMSLGRLMFFGLVAVAIYFIVHSLQADRSHNQPAPPTATADQLLAERFARGEIDAEEYAARRAVLHGTQTKKDLSHT